VRAGGLSVTWPAFFNSKLSGRKFYAILCRKMTTDKVDFDHGGTADEGFKLVEKPSKRVKKDSSAVVGLTECPATNVRTKTPHGLTFSSARQVRPSCGKLMRPWWW
jgi:hypothetical protein